MLRQSELSIYVRNDGCEVEYAVEALRTVCNSTAGQNLTELLELLERFQSPANDPGSCLLPNIDIYPPVERLRVLIALAVTLIRKEYVEELDQGKLPIGLGAIAMLYNLHFHRTMAAIRQPNFDRPTHPNPPPYVVFEATEGFVPPEETRRHLSTALQIRRQLKPIDEVITILYRAYMDAKLARKSLVCAGKLIFHVYENLQMERRANGLDEDAFFETIRRSASPRYLHLAYATLQWAAPVQENRSTLSAIQKAMSPRRALQEQGEFWVHKYGGCRELAREEIEGLPEAALWAGRPPDDLPAECAECRGSAKMTCSRCRLLRYCSKGCQAVHWRATHKMMCCIYRYGPRALPDPSASAI